MTRAPAAADVPLSRTAKVLFPDDGISKGDLVGHYREVADRMLPHLRGRPLALARYPDGITGQRIFQKNVSPHFPDWVSRAEVGKQGGSVCQVIADSAATLVYLANQACIELHPFLSTVDSLQQPDQLIVDLDPPDGDHFQAACRAALAVRDLLAGELGLTCYVKTTGGKGLHVQVPLAASEDFDRARRFARDAADLLARRHPDLLTTEQRRSGRDGLIYADVMRNAYAQTAVAPFSVRARPGAPVATPLDWSEVPGRGLRPGRFTVRTLPARLKETSGRNDPWAGMSRRHYSLAKAAAKLARLTG